MAKCIPCQEDCKTCNSREGCLTCLSGLSPSSSNNKCPSCEDKFQGCISCDEKLTTCLICIGGKTPKNNKCEGNYKKPPGKNDSMPIGSFSRLESSFYEDGKIKFRSFILVMLSYIKEYNTKELSLNMINKNNRNLEESIKIECNQNGNSYFLNEGQSLVEAYCSTVKNNYKEEDIENEFNVKSNSNNTKFLQGLNTNSLKFSTETQTLGTFGKKLQEIIQNAEDKIETLITDIKITPFSETTFKGEYYPFILNGNNKKNGNEENVDLSIEYGPNASNEVVNYISSCLLPKRNEETELNINCKLNYEEVKFPLKFFSQNIGEKEKILIDEGVYYSIPLYQFLVSEEEDKDTIKNPDFIYNKVIEETNDESSKSSSNSSSKKILAILLPIIGVIIVVAIIFAVFYVKKQKGKFEKTEHLGESRNTSSISDLEKPKIFEV